MWKLLLLFGMPLLLPLEIGYGLIMQILGPLGFPDILGWMATP